MVYSQLWYDHQPKYSKDHIFLPHLQVPGTRGTWVDIDVCKHKVLPLRPPRPQRLRAKKTHRVLAPGSMESMATITSTIARKRWCRTVEAEKKTGVRSGIEARRAVGRDRMGLFRSSPHADRILNPLSHGLRSRARRGEHGEHRRGPDQRRHDLWKQYNATEAPALLSLFGPGRHKREGQGRQFTNEIEGIKDYDPTYRKHKVSVEQNNKA
ncbi:hypothetical protein HD806DRAFT_536837 [Xylariaceae sp. AK1471]|nr:hypothetical protein HD806DRAFT_536837 [Xylariaceae sp. AK1471]